MLEGLKKLTPSEFAEFYFDFKPLPYQIDALNCEHKNVQLVWGRQTGKTQLTAIRGLYDALMNDNWTVVLLGPTRDVASRLFTRMKRLITLSSHKFPDLKILDYIDRETRTLFEFDNGSEIITHTIGDDGANIRGITAHKVIIDESGEVKNAEAWSAINPMTLVTHGPQWLIGTFRGTGSRFYEIYKDPKKFRFTTFMANSFENPYADKQQMEIDHETMSLAMWNQEYMNIPMEEADAFFPSTLVEKILSKYDQHEAPLSNHSYYLGVDPAGEGKDDTVYCIVAKGPIYTFVAKWIETKRQSLPQIEANIRLLHILWGFKKIWIDTTGGRNLHEFLIRDGIPAEGMVFSMKTKQEVYQFLKGQMQGKTFSMFHHDKAKKQLLDMRYEAVKIGDTANLKIYSGQSRSHNMPGGDDYPTALGLALWGIKIPEIPILFALARGAMTREMDI